MREKGLSFRLKREKEKVEKIQKDQSLKLEARLSAQRAILEKIQNNNARRAHEEATALFKAFKIQSKKRLERDYFKAIETNSLQVKDSTFENQTGSVNRATLTGRNSFVALTNPKSETDKQNFSSTAFQNFFVGDKSILLMNETQQLDLLDKLKKFKYTPKFDLR